MFHRLWRWTCWYNAMLVANAFVYVLSRSGRLWEGNNYVNQLGHPAQRESIFKLFASVFGCVYSLHARGRIKEYHAKLPAFWKPYYPTFYGHTVASITINPRAPRMDILGPMGFLTNQSNFVYAIWSRRVHGLFVDGRKHLETRTIFWHSQCLNI